MLTIPTDRLGRQGRSGPHQARGLLDRQVRRADRQRLAVVPGRGQRRADQRAVRHGQRSERRQRAVERGLSAGLGPAPGRPLGHERERRLALLHSRQRAEHLALDPSRRAPDRRDDGRDPEPDGRLRGRRSRRSTRRRSSSDPRNGAGAATSSAATTSNTAARTGGASFRIATITAARTTCPGCSTSCASSSAADRAAPARRLHGALLPAGRRVQRRRVERDAAAAQPLDPLAVGSRATSTRPGSTTASS